MTPGPPKVLIPCPGLGHAHRGFETFARECFEALAECDDLHVVLVKGKGPASGDDRTARTISRDALASRALGRLMRREPYVIEQLAFALRVAPMVARERPDVILLSEWSLARALGLLRSVTHARYKLVYSNGAVLWPPFPEAIDVVQQLTPGGLEVALRGGEAPERHVVLPLGLKIAPQLDPPSEAERTALRAQLGLPGERPIILSVAALNMWSKRLDYLIEEVASLPRPRPHLVLLGQHERETPAVLSLATRLLGEEGFTARTVDPIEVTGYYRAADVFVLASTTEGMGRVLVEAMAQGLPCVAHRYPITDFVLGDHGLTTDIRSRGALAKMLSAITPESLSREARAARHQFAYERFSWNVLAPSYAELFTRLARGG